MFLKSPLILAAFFFWSSVELERICFEEGVLDASLTLLEVPACGQLQPTASLYQDPAE